MTTQNQQCSHYKKSYGLCSNSFPSVRCESIATKITQYIENRHARGNVQQYYQKIVTEKDYDDSKSAVPPMFSLQEIIWSVF